MTSLRTLGSSDLSVFPLALGGNVFGWTADEDRVLRRARRLRRGRRQLRRHRRRLLVLGPAALSGGESETIIGKWLAARGNRDDLVIATKVGAHPEYKGLSASHHQGRRRGVAAPPRHRLHRPVLHALRRPHRARRGDHHRPRPAGQGRQGPRDRRLQHHPGAAPGVPGLLRPRGPRQVRGAPAALQPGLPRHLRGRPPGHRVARGPGRRPLLRAGVRLPHRQVPAGPARWTAPAPRARASTWRPSGAARCSPRSTGSPQEHGAEIATVALAWLAARPTVAAPIASARTVEQLPALLAVADLELTDAEVSALTVASA